MAKWLKNTDIITTIIAVQLKGGERQLFQA